VTTSSSSRATCWRRRDEARKAAPELHISTHLVEGNPARALVEAAQHARLLVVGSRGLGGFKGMVMGSVSMACAHHGHCPVVIVPPPDGPG